MFFLATEHSQKVFSRELRFSAVAAAAAAVFFRLRKPRSLFLPFFFAFSKDYVIFGSFPPWDGDHHYSLCCNGVDCYCSAWYSRLSVFYMETRTVVLVVARYDANLVVRSCFRVDDYWVRFSSLTSCQHGLTLPRVTYPGYC